MRRWILGLFFSFMFIVKVYPTAVYFPELYVYTLVETNLHVTTSYRMDVLFDTGIKYGLNVGMGVKQYEMTNISSNFIGLNYLKIQARPIDYLMVGYFIGKNRTLGQTDFGYNGFQHHQRENFEYIGYHDISGIGLEFGGENLFNGLFNAYGFVYQDPVLDEINMDTLMSFDNDEYKIEFYGGINNDFRSLTNLQKRFGMTLRANTPTTDFMISIFSPNSGFLYMIMLDDLYFQFALHGIWGKFFEQNLAIFSRPSYYHGVRDPIREDIDAYIASGLKIDRFGIGIENTFTYSRIYTFSDKVGIYAYSMLKGLKYQTGFYMNVLGDAFEEKPSGFYFSISGQL